LVAAVRPRRVGQCGYLRIAPTSHLPRASTSPPPFGPSCWRRLLRLAIASAA